MGGTPLVLATVDPYPRYLTVDAEAAYWTIDNGNTVHRVGLDGAGAAVLVTTDDESGSKGIASDDRYVYWVLQSSLRRVSKSGGDAVVLASGLNRPLGVAVDDRAVYWTDYGNQRVMMLAK